MSKFMISGDHDQKTTNNFLSPRQRTVFDGGVGREPSAMNILNSMGQSVYIFNLDDRIVYCSFGFCEPALPVLMVPGQKIPESPWGSPIPIGDEDGDVNRFPDGDGDGDGDEAEKQ
ncbi:hypothetical protein Tco_0741563 [Tanacetum coccineum]